MEHIEVVLDAPASLRLRELADSTSHVYKLLWPWCFSEQPSLPIFKSIRIQALSYVQAIDFSITAAQDGFSFCEDVIALAKFIDSSDEMQRQEYLEELAGMAQQAAENAEKAQAKFRNVRVIVGKLIRDARKQQSLSAYETASSSVKQLKEFEEGVSVLERFSGYISTYVSWWTIVHMGHGSQATRQSSVVIKYNAIRNQDVLQKWKELRQEYVLYTYKIGLIQATNPDFKMQLKKAHLDDLTVTQPSQTDSDNSKHESRRPPSVDPTGLKTAHLEDMTSIWISQKDSDNSNYDSRRLPDIDPSAMLFAPIAFATRTPASRSNITTKRDSILQAFESCRRITTPESQVATVRHGKKK